MADVDDFESLVPQEVGIAIASALEDAGFKGAADVQGHHLIMTDAANSNEQVKNFLKELRDAGKYDHNSLENLIWLPSNGETAAQLGVAKHSGRHLGGEDLGGYKTYVTEALEHIQEQYSKALKAGIDKSQAHDAAQNLDIGKAGKGKSRNYKVAATAIVVGAALTVSTTADAAEARKKIQEFAAAHLNQEQLEKDFWIITEGIVEDAATETLTRILAGPAGMVALTAVDLYDTGRSFIKVMREIYPNQPLWELLDTKLDKFETTVKAAGKWLGDELVKAAGFSGVYTIDGVLDAADPLTVKGSSSDDLYWISGNAKVSTGAGRDWVMDFGVGDVDGGEGNDFLLGWTPKYYAAGDKLDPEEKDGPVATKEMRLTLKGGAGDDKIIVLGGEGAIAIGGDGKDFIFNTSFKGQIYGDSRDGTGARSTDVFSGGPRRPSSWTPARRTFCNSLACR